MSCSDHCQSELKIWILFFADKQGQNIKQLRLGHSSHRFTNYLNHHNRHRKADFFAPIPNSLEHRYLPIGQKSIYQCHVLPDGQRFRLSYVGSQEPGHHEGQEVLVEGDAAFPQHVLPVAAEILNKLERWLRTDAASCGNPVCRKMVHGIILHHCVGGKQTFSMPFKPWTKQPN